ncbi:MAG TPA: hypothetical protein VIV07_02290 [Sphingomicrobium sp.]
MKDNRGFGHARMFLGGLLLFATVIVWAVTLMMSPHGPQAAPGTEHVRTTVASFVLKSAIGTLLLCALSGWLLFGLRRPKWPARDYAILGLIGLMVLSSLYQLIWGYRLLH